MANNGFFVRGNPHFVRNIVLVIVSLLVLISVCPFAEFNLLRSTFIGPPGPAGQSVKGDKGDKGDPGAQGQGIAGKDGVNGLDGKNADPNAPAFVQVMAQLVATQVAQALPTATPLPTATDVPPTATLAPTATQPPAATKAPVATQAPVAMAAPVTAALAAAAPAIAAPVACILDGFPEAARFGVQLTVDQKPDINWEFNPASAARVAGDTTHPELAADADLAGCPVIVEGRKDVSKHEHHIWILVPGDKQYLDSDGIFRAREFSAWAYPTNWNLDDFSTTKPPVAAEFIDGKRNNQQTNGYDWPIFVHQSTGNTLEFKPGTKIGAPLPNNCDFAEPSHLNVTGVYDSSAKTFDASIGAEGCWTAAYDGNANGGVWTDWQGAKDNYIIHYPTKFEAWLFPSTYTEMDVTAWEIKHIVGQP